MRTETSEVINRPIEEVWAFLTDPYNIPRFGLFTLGSVRSRLGPYRSVRLGRGG
jgi:uncharacterized protein YndB with AHSA1/START domain